MTGHQPLELRGPVLATLVGVIQLAADVLPTGFRPKVLVLLSSAQSSPRSKKAYRWAKLSGRTKRRGPPHEYSFGSDVHEQVRGDREPAADPL